MYYRKLKGKTLFITGASRGIGKAIALKAARDGANIVIAAKTAEPHPKLLGTIYTAAEESKCVLLYFVYQSPGVCTLDANVINSTFTFSREGWGQSIALHC